ncbi:maleylacetoacetate isomerase (plasmid) [Azospirillum sp. B510]|uniref:maleylacetoacetate isomerase n=1 Tax=Azospirillum sp. (strain B510) TaxID=137722 RepID=UPI0001C4BBFD|nr:maleylacetoacetate isomerase [Azospirillum sp. B510]BAI74455.1 maleylacetoacetate isomerase [Azospirillum sp. B510]
MKVYDYFRSSAAYRLRIALNLKGLTAERHFIHLRRKEQSAPGYLAVNPMGLLPALEVDGRTLTQSLAIIEYLDETHPTPALLPRDPLDRAWVRSLALAVACDIHPVNNLRILNHLRDALGQDEEARNGWYAHWVAEGFRGLETMLAGDDRVGVFCFGDEPTLADICLVPQVFNAARMSCPLDDYPTIRRIAAAAGALPAFQAAEPGRQPDAE